MVQGLDAQVTSAIIPIFMICASICPKPACRALTSARGDQDPSWSHHRIDHISGPQRKLLHAPVYAGTDDRLPQFHFGLCQCRFGTRLLSWQKRGNPLLGLLFCSRCGGDSTLATLQIDLKFLDVSECDVTGIASLQFLLGLEFVYGLLVGALRLLNLSFSLHYLGLRHHHLCVSLRNFPPRTLRCGLLLRAVQPEDRRSFADWAAYANVDLGNATIDLRNDRDGSKE